jgi:glycosyltransferase involved in cell wall biosynthesis
VNYKESLPLMRILWLSNKVQSKAGINGSGSWLEAMTQALLNSGEVELGNIARGNVTSIQRQDCGPICQWVIPYSVRTNRKDNLPPKEVINDIGRAIDDFSPDLVEVWGTEFFWGLLTARGLIKYPAILEMQGLKSAIARVFNGGLTFREQVASIGPIEIWRHSTLFQVRRQFQNWGKFEKEIISGHRYIIAQSAWLKAQLRAINRNASIYHNEFPLNELFYSSESWTHGTNPVIFCSASYPAAFKGLHVAIRMLAILKDRFPNVQLRIAGSRQESGLRQDGYVAWLKREAHRLGVESNLTWLGLISTQELIRELQCCSVFLVPTFVEGYCLALAEAMLLGVPTVVAFTGGTSYLARDEESALFFPPGDDVMAAFQIERLLTEHELAGRLSKKARDVALERNSRPRIIQNQLEIYRQVLVDAGDRKKPDFMTIGR